MRTQSIHECTISHLSLFAPTLQITYSGRCIGHLKMNHDYSELFRAAQESDHLFDDDFEQDVQNDYSDDFSVSQIGVSEAQYDVITHPCNMNEVLSVRAGPGSGKTFTIAARIAYLLENGMDPSQILVLSMANRSVDALRDSLAGIIGKDAADRVEISTFHSFCGLLIDQYSPILQPNLATRRIFDKKCWYNLAQFFLSKLITLGDTKLEGNITPLRLDKLLAEVTNGDLTVDEAAAKYKINASYIDTLVGYLNRHGMMRYSDLVKNALSLIALLKNMNNDPEGMVPVGMSRLQTYKAVFVDEFQDMYPSLMSVVMAIVSYPTFDHENTMKHLTISGDPNQSIYDFLGASSSTMSKVGETFPSMKIVEKPLAESYRCTQPNLDAATEISLRNEDRISLLSNREPDMQAKPILLHHQSQESEFAFVTDEIVRLICCLGGLIYPKDIAVLTRTNAEAERIQVVLKERYGLRSNKISQGNLWVTSPMHIYRDILSVISGESDSSFSLLNLLPILDPARGSRLRVSKMFNASVKRESRDINFLESYIFDELVKAQNDKGGNDSPTEEKEGTKADKSSRKSKKVISALETLFKNHKGLLENIARFLNQVQFERRKLQQVHLRNPMDYDPTKLAKCLANMAQVSGIHEYIFGNHELDSPFSNYLESFNNSLHHSYEGYSARPDLQENLTFVDYFLQTYDDEVSVTSNNFVQVSTIHSAKGLEFPIVFVIGTGKYRPYWDSYFEGEPKNEGEMSDGGTEMRDGGKIETTSERKDINEGMSGSAQKLEVKIEEEIVDRVRVEQSKGDSDGDGDGQARAPKSSPRTLSSSHLLYVALTRARDLVYIGTALSWDQLLSRVQSLFSCQVPELGTPSPLGVDNISGDYCGPADAQAAIFGQIGTNQHIHNVAFPHRNETLWGLCKDLNRPYPLHRKLEQGIKSYWTIAKSTPLHVSSANRPSLRTIDGRLHSLHGTFGRSKMLIRRI